ncbi:MAG: nucleoside deaminase [Oscillospiraceae bacterium]|nr:nucleoside deaminase [Oscillospiraceae bacterium]
MTLDFEYMTKALTLAEQAYALGEAPIGAIVTDSEGTIVGSGHNLRETRQSPIAHAEIIAIEQAAAALGSWKLEGCTLYVTLEPCLMCAGAIMQARLKRVVYGAFADKTGALSSVTNVYEHRFGYSPMVRGGILQAECTALLNRFGKNLRSM